jgi:EAL domain-containing protein (putative c-di-GMP-specific phosphodiesterase class I)
VSEGARPVSARESGAARRLLRALHAGDLAFAFQPIVAAATRRVGYWECLLRLAGERDRPIGGTGMIGAAERLGFAPVLDRRTLAMALETLARHPAAALSVNLSGETVADRAWLAVLTGRLERDAALGRRLVVEITETAALRDIGDSRRFVERVRALGVRVAIDDFGAGHTSFRDLLALAPDIVKIDSAYAAGSAAGARSRAFVRRLTAAARARGWAMVAEGVAKDEDEAFLVAEGVEYFQGGRYGPPQVERPWKD